MAYPFLDSPYGYEVLLIVDDDGSNTWTNKNLGTNKTRTRKGRFKIEKQKTLCVGRKSFNISQEPRFNYVSKTWSLALDSVRYIKVQEQ